MHSTLQQTDPHDAFAIEPDFAPAARIHQASPDPVHEVLTLLSQRRAQTASGVPLTVPTPTVDTTFRAAVVDDINAHKDPSALGRWAKNATLAFLFALFSAIAAAGWQHYGAAATQALSDWTPSLALVSSPATETTGLAGQGDAAAAQAAAGDQASPPPTATTPPASGAAPSADAERLQSMARDLAAMGQQIEALKASIAELKANQQAMARDAAKAPDAEGSEVKAPDSKPVAQAARPKPPVPPRAQAALPRRPVPAYYAPATAAPPPQQLTPSASWQAAPSPPPAAQYDGDDPVVRPPMALR